MATTADCWSVHHKSYLGSTLHWPDPQTRKRQHAVHTCQSLKGAHTFNVLAQAVTGIHTEFQLQDKVIRTTTDNVSNFVKAFQQFSTEAAVLPAATAEEDLDGDDISIDNNGNEDVALSN